MAASYMASTPIPGTARPKEIGTWAWTSQTSGGLSAGERWRLRPKIILGALENIAGRGKLIFGLFPTRAHVLNVNRSVAFVRPRSKLAQEAHKAFCLMTPAFRGHSLRTWMFGLALAHVDGNLSELDPSLFYCAALLHDYGLSNPGRASSGTQRPDFTLAGAARARACAMTAGLGEVDTVALEDAICVHATPGVSIKRNRALGCYLQWGSMLDGIGSRRWDVANANVNRILCRYPRQPDFKQTLAAAIREEAAAVEHGRFALLVHWGFPLSVRLAPFHD